MASLPHAEITFSKAAQATFKAYECGYNQMASGARSKQDSLQGAEHGAGPQASLSKAPFTSPAALLACHMHVVPSPASSQYDRSMATGQLVGIHLLVGHNVGGQLFRYFVTKCPLCWAGILSLPNIVDISESLSCHHSRKTLMHCPRKKKTS